MVNSSLGYEILLYLNTYYYCFFAVAEVGVFIFKINHLPYPAGVLISEILILLLLTCTEASRIFVGRKGNLTEKIFSIVISIGLTVPSIIGVLYFLRWQTYVLRLEVILCGIQLILEGLELCFASLCLLRFCRAPLY